MPVLCLEIVPFDDPTEDDFLPTIRKIYDHFRGMEIAICMVLAMGVRAKEPHR